MFWLDWIGSSSSFFLMLAQCSRDEKEEKRERGTRLKRRKALSAIQRFPLEMFMSRKSEHETNVWFR